MTTAFSYSRLINYETCPRKFYATSIAKTVVEPESEAMNYGKAVHKSLELRVSMSAPLPAHLSHLEPLMARVVAAPGDKHTELQMAVNEAMVPTSWFAKDVYCRAIADLVIDAGTKAAMFDYKTGKKSDDFLQLRLTSTLYFMRAPELESIECAFVWTKDKSVTKTRIKREEIGEVWSSLAPRIARYQEAFDKMEFPPRPGRHCRWCVVKTCPYWEGKV